MGLLLATIIMVTMMLVPVLATTENMTYKQTYWFDESGNMISDEQLIDKLENASVQMSRGYVCCKNQKLETYYNEDHMYQRPLPSLCVYYKYRIIYCAGCNVTLSNVKIGEYTHTHQP